MMRLACRKLVSTPRHTPPCGAATRWICADTAATDGKGPDEEEEIEDANERYSGRVEVRHTGDDDRGRGVFALKDFAREELVIRGSCLYVEPEQGTHTIQTDWDKHVIMDLPARYVNHVCGLANLGIQDNDVGAYDFVALRDIEAGEELLWDYEATEYVIEKFECKCGSPVCRRILQGYRRNGSRVRAVYGDKYIAAYLKQDREP